MKRTHYLVLVLLILIFSCRDNKEKGDSDYSESKKIYGRALEIHDEVMPKMGTIMDLQKELKQKKEQTEDEEKIKKINASLQQLENAHRAMMNWMRNLTPLPDTDKIDDPDPDPTPEEMKNIQQQSLENIKEVKKKINSSIEEARILIDSLNT